MKMPNPDLPTMERLIGIKELHDQDIGRISSEIFSAVVSFLMWTVGPQKTAEIMRDWAGMVQRATIKEVEEQDA